MQDVVSTSEPVIDAQGNILFGANNGGLFSISKEGTTNWRVNIGKGAQSSPTLDHEQHLYLVVNHGDRNSLYKVDGAGNLLWATRLEHNKHFEPILDQDGNIYIVTWHDLVKIISAGYHLWSFSCRNISSYPGDRGFINSPALSNEGYLVLGTTYFWVCAVDTSGQLLWETDLGQITQFSPILDHRNQVYLFTVVKKRKPESYIWCLDQDGQPLWKHRFRGAMTWFNLSLEGLLLTKYVDADRFDVDLVAYEMK
ncbi:Outer membrane protein assembly factor BamB [compost metagenome]